MVCVHESYLHRNVFASSSPGNSYVSQYRGIVHCRLQMDKEMFSQHCHFPRNAKYYVQNILISSPIQISDWTLAILAYFYRSFPHSLQISVRLIDRLAITVCFLILCN
jgi:hypothetical protein